MGNCLRLGISRVGLAWTKRRMKTTIKRNAISLLILGTQASGKTTIALRLWKYKRTLPDLHYVQTKGFNTFTIKRKNKSPINLYDLGGHSSIQELWDHYYADAHGVIFVVDVSAENTMSDAAEVFAKVLQDERIRGKPILLLANKQDLREASDTELDGVMNLQEVVNGARCLTRLDECASTDLKNDKGIFEGFRWLVSHIENHYHELNDRVIHDTLEEKNREKARRAAAREELAQEGTDTEDKDKEPQKKTVERPSSQKSLPSRTFIREESTLDLNQYGKIPLSPFDNPMMMKKPTNYLIKSRPNSSLGDSRNPFLARNVSTAPGTGAGRRISLPVLPAFRLTSGNPFLVHSPVEMEMDSSLPEQKETKRKEESSLSSAESGKSKTAKGPHPPGRLSPEGAEGSDEGPHNHKNPAFHDSSTSDKSLSTITNGIEWYKGELTGRGNVSVSEIPSIMELSPPLKNLPFSSPQKFRKLSRTESSDTERNSGEILMVTTLAQVHQDQKGRRGSTTDSVALSLSSFKSEDNSFERLEDFSRNHSYQERMSPLPQGSTTTGISGNAFTVSEAASNKGYHRLDKDKPRKSLLKVGLGKNKTSPFGPGTKVDKVPGPGPPGTLNKMNRTVTVKSLKTIPPPPLRSRSRENVFQVSSSEEKGEIKNKLKKRDSNGFPSPNPNG